VANTRRGPEGKTRVKHIANTLQTRVHVANTRKTCGDHVANTYRLHAASTWRTRVHAVNTWWSRDLCFQW